MASRFRLSLTPRHRSPNPQRADLVWPGVLIALVLNGVLVGYALLAPLSPSVQRINLVFGLSGLILTIIASRWLLPYSQNPLNMYLGLALNALVILLAFYFHNLLLPGYTIVLGITLITLTAVLYGRWATYGLFGVVTLVASGLYAMGWLRVESLWQQATLFLLTSALLAETILRLRHSYIQQLAHLNILNRAAQALASTIEYHQVINLACSLVQEAVQADGYYLGLLQGDRLRLELIYDSGEYFPPTEVSLDDTLVVRVIHQGKSLLIQDMETEGWKYRKGIRYVGQPRMSQSWLGVPMIVGGKVIGAIVVASYRKHAFTLHEVWLLENLARQAALAIENARHHLQVEERARLDSLTQVLNHNAFLEVLEKELVRARLSGSPLSLIMLDVDYFKDYNDTFGHLLGDQVLQRVIEVIRQHLKRTDWVGRWGGEEFVVALPNATGAQAYQVAQRIREALRKIRLTDPSGRPVVPPTVSQGIAVFPDEAKEVFTLIDLADQRLYQAKSRGRDQIEPSPAHWSVEGTSDSIAASVEPGRETFEVPPESFVDLIEGARARPQRRPGFEQPRRRQSSSA